MAQPDWTAIFSVREDLRPPGYDATFLDMLENPRERPARGKSKGKEEEAGAIPEPQARRGLTGIHQPTHNRLTTQPLSRPHISGTTE